MHAILPMLYIIHIGMTGVRVRGTCNNVRKSDAVGVGVDVSSCLGHPVC